MNAPRLALSALSVSLLCAAMIGCAQDADEPEAQGSAQAAVHTGYGYEMMLIWANWLGWDLAYAEVAGGEGLGGHDLSLQGRGGLHSLDV